MTFRGRSEQSGPEEYLDVMRSLWTEETASYSGSTYTLPESSQRPMPLQKPHPPIYFGGESDPALERVADIGDGWFGWVSPEDASTRVGDLHRLLDERGRAHSSVNVSLGCGWPGEGGVDHAAIETYANAGADQLILSWPGATSAEEALRGLDETVAYLGDALTNSIEKA